MLHLISISVVLYAQKNKSLQVTSPDGAIIVNVEAGVKLEWSIKHKGQLIILPSAIGLQLESGEVPGDDPKITSSKMEKVKKEISAINYKKATILDEYNQLTIRCKGDFGVLFRAYNDGVAYRIFTSIRPDDQKRNHKFQFRGGSQGFYTLCQRPKGNRNLCQLI